MAKEFKNKDFASNAPIVTRSYRGPDRRQATEGQSGAGVWRQVKFDDKGNPVLQVGVDVLRRREGDRTIDLLKCLDADALSLKPDE